MAKKEVILYVGLTGLKLFGVNTTVEDAWPEGALDKHKVLSELGLKQRVMEFLEKLDLKSLGVRLVIGSEMVFEKALGKWRKEMVKEIETYLSEINLEKDEVWIKINRIGAEVKAVVVPKRLVEVVEEALVSEGVRVEQTISEGELEMSVEERAKQNQILELLKEIKSKADKSFRGEVGNAWGKFFLGVVALLVVGVGVFSLWQWNETTRENTNQPAEVVPTATPSPTPTPTPMPKLRVKILNGTGVTGQAGEIAAKLNGEWLGEVTTGNYPGGSDKNMIMFVASISGELKLKVAGDVGEVLEGLSVEEAKKDQVEEVVIVTGE